MTLGDLYPDVRLCSQMETNIWEGGGGKGEMGGGSGRTYGKGRRGRGMRKGAQEGEKSEVSANSLQWFGVREMCGERRCLQ